ncbi:MAG: hypothetical protein QW707_03625 [Candidatus Bathyarchaeia archaeon]
MSSLKLKLPGAVYFISNVYSLFTGLAFTVIVTRSLTVSDFGFWTMISQYLAYTSIPFSNIASFWIVRYVARGFKQAPKSGLIFGLALSSIGLLLYLLLALLANTSFSQPLSILLLAAPQAATYILLGALSSAITGTSPIHIGISSVIFETSKVLLAYSSVRILRMGLIGAIISVVMAQVIQVIYLLIILQKHIKHESADHSLLKRWFKLSWLPAYGLFSGLIGGLDVLIARIISSTDELIGVKNVAGIAGSFPKYASSLSLSLYPRSLRTINSKDWERDVEELLRFISLISIPIAFGNIALMDLLLEIFGRSYVNAYLAGVVITIISLIGLMNSIIDPILLGSETIDLKDEVIFKEYLRSRIFKLITLNHISAITYLIAVIVALSLYTGDIYQATLYWSLASFIGIPYMTYKIKILKEIGVHLKFPTGNILRYTLASGLIFLLIYVLKGVIFQNIARNIIGLLTGTLTLTVIGGCLYLLIALLIDGYARIILSQVIISLRKIFFF